MNYLKKTLLTILIIFLALTSNLGLVTAQNETSANETEEYQSKCFSEEEIESNIKRESERKGDIVKTPTGGSRNITFEDGYNGYCINKGWAGAEEGDEFTVQDTSIVKHNKNNEDVSNYLKLLFTYHHDFAVENKDETANIVWTFSDWDYKTSDNPVIKSILNLSESGIIIPDHGFVKKINETTEALFNFEVLKASEYRHQSFFGYKITYRTIPVEEKNNISGGVQEEPQENNTTNDGAQSESIPEKPQENDTLSNEEINDLVFNNTTLPEINSHENNTQQKQDYNKPENSIPLNKHVTGNNALIIGLLIIIIGSILILKYSRD